MKQEHFKQAVDRLKEVNGVVEGLDERIRSEAFEILKPYVVGGLPTSPGPNASDGDGSSPALGGDGSLGVQEFRTDGSGDARSFLVQHEGDKPSDNVYAIAAWWYSQYGRAPLDRRTVERIAEDEGVMIPTRPDSTLDKGTYEGKPKFMKKAKGFVPTITGEQWMVSMYGIRKGTGTPPDDFSDA